ncbi:3-dehydroquinate synthase [Metabacillus sp. HB246100]|uniref:3-dehydroquinate synthase n=1 Tax=Bacillus weihaiensis TaxID=1547283 RepID=UPI002355282C|nr:3-dehydroquinate synthase [Bacillus weihaiensis]
MQSVQVKTTDSIYPIIVGENILHELTTILANLEPSKVLLVTDDLVDQLYGDKVLDLLKKNWSTCKYVIENGEASKSFPVFYNIQTYALKEKLDRNSVIIAFGGGVVGDLAGFVAATFMRGIPYIQVPTTLLAHDSAVGGKVAINHPEGKNMIGAFYQPKAVLYDSSFLKSLPKDELRSGFAEVIKHSLIRNETFYHFLNSTIKDLSDLTSERLSDMILEGIKIKADVVSKDEKELGLREILNFGHTLGHAIESQAGYGKISHGDCVAIGMIFAVWLSQKTYHHHLNYDEIVKWFNQIGFPTRIPTSFSSEDLLNKMLSDKKTRSNQIKMILLEKIGVTSSKVFTKEELLTLLEQWREMEEEEIV